MDELITVNDKGVLLSNGKDLCLRIYKTSKGFCLGDIIFRDHILRNNGRGLLTFQDTLESYEKIQAFGKDFSIIQEKNKAFCKFTGKIMHNNVNIDFSLSIEIRRNEPGLGFHFWFSPHSDIYIRLLASVLPPLGKGWMINLYPWAAGAGSLIRNDLNYVGVPAALIYSENSSLGLLYAIDYKFDYSHPGTWRGSIGILFNENLPPTFTVGQVETRVPAKAVRELPVQLFFTDTTDKAEMVINLVNSWRTWNKYHFPTPRKVMNTREAVRIMLEGRRKNIPYIKGRGYIIDPHRAKYMGIYITSISMNAYCDYKIFEKTEDIFWRDRAFEQADFLVTLQIKDGPNKGAWPPVCKNYGREVGFYDSRTYEVDCVAMCARYLLLLYDEVKRKEGIDKAEWKNASVLALDWVCNKQMNNGAIPAFVNADTGEPEVPQSKFAWGEYTETEKKQLYITPGRVLLALQDAYRLTKINRYFVAMRKAEEWVLKNNLSKLRFTGGHPDLPPCEIEESNLYRLAEYWVKRYESEKDERFLVLAKAVIYLGFLSQCPKQLPWVENPTAGGATEQQHYLQYSVYSYNGMKYWVLRRIAELTKERFFNEWYELLKNHFFFTLITSGPYYGGVYERICDPWLARDSKDFNSMGWPYTGELVTEAILQFINEIND